LSIPLALSLIQLSVPARTILKRDTLFSCTQSSLSTVRYPLFLTSSIRIYVLPDLHSVDTILVISHEKLQIELDRLLSPQGLTVLRIPKSGGVVDLDDTYRQLVHAFQIRTYFYGEPELPSELALGAGSDGDGGMMGRVVEREKGLSPYSFQIGWETLSILRVGEGGYTRTLCPIPGRQTDEMGLQVPPHHLQLYLLGRPVSFHPRD
jgi:hypothetical protein